MSNKIKAHLFNMLTDLNATVTGTGWEAAYPAEQLLDYRLTRRMKATAAADEKAIIIDGSAIPAAFRGFTDLILSGHNLSNLNSINVYTNSSNSWGAPANSVEGLSILADPDTDPDLFGETNITLKPYRNPKWRMPSDLMAGGNTWIKIVFTVAPGDPMEIANIHAGWGLQWQINHRFRWGQGFTDLTKLLLSSGNVSFHDSSKVADTLRTAFDPSIVNDTHYIKYILKQFGNWRPFWISEEPEQEVEFYEKEQIRAHGLTFYGRARISAIQERSVRAFRYELHFKEEFGGPGLPPYALDPGIIHEVPAAAPDTVLVDLGNFNFDLGVIPSAETLKGQGFLVELGGCRKCLFLTGNIIDTNSGEIAVVYKFNKADSVYHPLDGVDGPKISLGSVGGTHSGWRDIDPAAYEAGAVYIYFVVRGGDDADTGGAGRLILQLAEAAP